MKTCHNCNAAISDSASFCPNCGCSAPSYPAHPRRTAKEAVSVGGWIGRSLIPMIPLVGGIVYLIMLFIWSGDQKKEDTFRNWAKAQLIITAVVVVLSIILALLGATVFSDLLSSL